MNLYAILALVSFITCLIVAIIVFRHKLTSLHAHWIYFILAVSIWEFGAFRVGMAKDPVSATLWWRIGHVGIIFLPVFLFQVTYDFCSLNKVVLLRAIYFQAIVFLVVDVFTSHFISGVRYAFDSFYYGILGWAYHPFFIIWLFIVALSHYYLFVSFNKLHGLRKTQIKYFLTCNLVGFSGGLTNFLPAYGIDIYPLYGCVSTALYCAIFSYAVLKYRFMDISLVVTRTSIFIAVYSVVLGIPFALVFFCEKLLTEILGQRWWLVPLISSTILATGGPFIYLFLQKRAEARLFQEQSRYQTTLRQASLGMGRIKDLKRLVTLIVHIVTRTVRLEHTAIYVKDRIVGKFILGSMRSRQARLIFPDAIEFNESLVQELILKKAPIVFDEIQQQTKDFGDSRLAKLERDMTQVNAALIVPSFIDEELKAIIILGRKISGSSYTNDDLAVFSILANQAALAIENAQFYEDMKKTHEQLFKAEKMATIGTMADGLSHQINNRLHALGFIAGDALDTIRLKKNMSMSPEVQEVFVDVEHALVRIQENVAQGGEIVQGLLKYTRKGEEGFAEVDLDHLVNAAVEMTQFKVKPGEIKILREFKAGLPKINGNFTQLQEVFFNLLDNAYDAMMQRKHDFKDPNYEPTVRIFAESRKAGFIEVIFEDNGMGIKDDDKEKLFTPFFTTKLSSKKGTGLGLYVIRKLIEENHGGKVTYVSRFAQGTRVYLTLPTIAGAMISPM